MHDGSGRPAIPGPAIAAYEGDRRAIRHLFALAEDSSVQLDAYLRDGEVLVAVVDHEVVGHIQIVPVDSATVEIRNMAVVEGRRRRGLGQALVHAAFAHATATGIRCAVVATATADIGNLAFYQRLGFRMARIERDAFGPHNGYAGTTSDEGIPIRDRVWLDIDLVSGRSAT